MKCLLPRVAAEMSGPHVSFFSAPDARPAERPARLRYATAETMSMTKTTVSVGLTSGAWPLMP